ncbi:unnamed protein product [Gongylonema pulchrum]|uniref:Not3 domain-containing protein n=1 Tax=Gongylonema pulchrum TaxID=637853 RepID=A0A183EK37_9BILA|nr:unnamed protein product [Gongylonema pulchrum]
MSAGTRRATALTKARLKKYLEELKNFSLDLPPSTEDEEAFYEELQNLKMNDRDIRRVVENIERILRQLKSLGEPMDQPYLEMMIEQ